METIRFFMYIFTILIKATLRKASVWLKENDRLFQMKQAVIFYIGMWKSPEQSDIFKFSFSSAR